MANPFSISNNGPVKLSGVQKDTLAGILSVPSSQGPVVSLSSTYNPPVIKSTKPPMGLTGRVYNQSVIPNNETLNPISKNLFDPVKHTLNLIKNATAQSVINKSIPSVQPIQMPQNDTTNNLYWDDSNITSGGMDTTITQDIPVPTEQPIVKNTAPMVDGYSKDWLNDAQSGTADDFNKLYTQGANLNQVRNDIYSGTIDPYKLGVKSGIPFTAGQLDAIENSMGKSIDPVINDIKARIATKEKGTGNLNQMTDNERALLTMFQNNQIVKDYNTIVAQKNTMDSIINNGSGGPTDMAAIFTFMKALDPNSVVRESEYDNAAKSGNLFRGIYTKFNGYFKENGGILPDSLKKEFQGIINNKLKAQENQYINYANGIKTIAERQGMNPNNVIIDFSGGVLNTQQPQPSQVPEYRVNPDGSISVFKKVGGVTNKASINTVEDAMKRISNVESGGNYKAIGPLVQSGQYKGQKALGKYQVMYGNVGPWSKEVLGYEVTPQEFYNSPQIQDALVAGKMAQLYSKHKNWDDVASVWFTGQPLSKGANKQDVLGTSGREYVNKFNA